MKLQEGPAFGAMIIGSGLAYLIWAKSRNLPLAIGAGVAIALADYLLLIWIQSFKKKK